MLLTSHTTLSRFVLRTYQVIYLCVCVCVCVCARVCVCVGARARARLRPFTVKASSVWNSWITREQINNVTVKMFISYAKFLHRYFGMQHLTFQTIHFILFTH